jgi:hypothetical protein
MRWRTLKLALECDGSMSHAWAVLDAVEAAELVVEPEAVVELIEVSLANVWTVGRADPRKGTTPDTPRKMTPHPSFDKSMVVMD